MRSRLSLVRAGLSVSAMLAVLYTALMLFSLLIVGRLTTGSWQAFLLGIGWSTIAGYAIGVLGVVIAGFAVAVVYVSIYNALQRPVTDWTKTLLQTSQPGWQAAKSWQLRLLAACLVLPVLTLPALRALASSYNGAAPTTQSPSSQLQPVAMGVTINTARRESEPSFTADGQTMYFNCNSGDICVSHLTGTWEEGKWTPPKRLEAPISTEYEEVEPVINATGDKLYFTSRRPGGRLWRLPFLSPFLDVFRVINTLAAPRLGRSLFGGLGLSDVYVTYRIDGSWSEPRSINEVSGAPAVNTEFDDHCLFFSADENEAFWTSTRPGGLGDDDIWTSRLVDGKWTEPENLGPNVNGPGSEHTSIPTPDGHSLYITTTRPEGFGKEDIYITTRGAEGGWGPLINLGPTINGPGDDRCPAWTPDLKIFLFDSVRQGGYGARDIWWTYFKDVKGYPIATTNSNSVLATEP